MKVLVTGATGFIGSHVATQLARAGHEVVATARDTSKLPSLADVDGIRLQGLDLSERVGWTDLLQGCEALVHIALGWGDAGPDMLANDTAASVALFEAARQAGVHRIIYTSSTAANGEMTPVNSADRAPRPVDLYGATKAATEMFARAYAATTGMRIHVVRPGYVFGEPAIPGAHAQPDRRFHGICRDVRSGKPVKLVKHDGTQFLHVQDISQVYLRLLEHPARYSLHYALSRDWRSWEWVAKEAMAIAGRQVPLEIEDLGYGESPFLFDVAPLRDDFGLSFGNEERLREHLRWELSLQD